MRAPGLLCALLLVATAAFAGTGTGQLPPLGDPLVDDQWGLDAVNATGAWQTTKGNGDGLVAVVDSGVDLTHLDLKMNLWDGNLLHGASTARGVGVFAGLPVGPQDTTMDDADHGTAVAGVVGAVADNGLGVRGMAQVPMIVVKIYGVGAPGHAEALAEGIQWAVENGARVITISITGSDHAAVRAAVDEAWCAGVVLVAASGNFGSAEPAYPSRYPEVISVGAVAQDLTLWEHSNRGVDLYAPGVDVLTTALGNQYAERTGTSFATPFVAGAAALVISANPELSNVDVVDLLKGTAKPLPGADAPLLDAGAAVEAAMASSPSGGPDCSG